MVTVNDDTSDVAGPTTGGRVPVGRGAIEIRRRARRAARDSAPSATVFLVIDCSGSMAGQNLERARIGSVEFAESALASGYAVGLIQFASTATMVCEPQRDLSALREAADRLEAGGFTEMGRGIAMADADLGSRGGRRAMIVVTDGLPTKRRDAVAAAERAKRRGVQIITIGTGDADEGFLRQVASRGDRAVMVPLVDLASGIRSSAKMLSTGAPVLPSSEVTCRCRERSTKGS